MKIKDKLSIDLHNYYLALRDKQWVSKRHYVKCKLCGKEIYSQYLYGKEVSEYSPESCGWKYVRGNDGYYKGWICHSCNGHFYEHWINRDQFKDCIEYEQEVEIWEPVRDRHGAEIMRFPKYVDQTVTINPKKLLKAFGIEFLEDAEIKYELKEN